MRLLSFNGLLDTLKRRTFRSLRHKNYQLYFIGQIISFTGSWMQNAALMWLLFDRTGDIRWPSYLLVVQVGPTVLLGSWGGQLADRWPKRRLIIWTQSAFLINALFLGAVVAIDFQLPTFVLMLQLMSGIVQSVDLPARLAFVPDLVPKEDLINAVGLNSLLFNTGRALGPAAAGLLFWAVGNFVESESLGFNSISLGAICCFGFNAFSYLAVLAALGGITVQGNAQSSGHGQTTSYWDGIRYLRDHPPLGNVILMTLCLCIFGWPVLTLAPGYTRLHLGLDEKSYTILVSGVGIGALIGAFLTATLGSIPRRGLFLVIGSAATSLGILGLASVRTLPLATLMASLVGFGLILFLSTGQSTIQLAVPDAKRGRVMALWAMTLSASAPLGHLLAGQAAKEFGIITVLEVMAAGVGVVSLGMRGLMRRGTIELR